MVSLLPGLHKGKSHLVNFDIIDVLEAYAPVFRREFAGFVDFPNKIIA